MFLRIMYLIDDSLLNLFQLVTTAKVDNSTCPINL